MGFSPAFENVLFNDCIGDLNYINYEQLQTTTPQTGVSKTKTSDLRSKTLDLRPLPNLKN